MDEHPSASAFAAAVVRQLTRLSGGGAASASKASITDEVTDLLRFAQECGSESGHLATRLAENPVLLSVFFQNIDLLYEHGYPRADTLSGAIMGAVELLEKR